MVAAGIPYAIGAGVFGCIALLAYATDLDLRRLLGRYSAIFKTEIDRADLAIAPEDFALGLVGTGALLWVAIVIWWKPSLVITLCSFVAVEGIVLYAGIIYLRLRNVLRLRAFADQFEMALRAIAGALRVGIGLRQALVIVVDELPDPARREFRRVIGRTNFGIALVDAIEEMAKTIPGNEMQMFTRVIRVQAQTGGDLATVLENLAMTIRDRRRIVRKMNGLTAQGRFGGAIIGGLPVMVGGFVLTTQPDMAAALFHTHVGWAILGAIGLLEFAAAFVIFKILQLDV